MYASDSSTMCTFRSHRVFRVELIELMPCHRLLDRSPLTLRHVKAARSFLLKLESSTAGGASISFSPTLIAKHHIKRNRDYTSPFFIYIYYRFDISPWPGFMHIAAVVQIQEHCYQRASRPQKSTISTGVTLFHLLGIYGEVYYLVAGIQILS